MVGLGPVGGNGCELGMAACWGTCGARWAGMTPAGNFRGIGVLEGRDIMTPVAGLCAWIRTTDSSRTCNGDSNATQRRCQEGDRRPLGAQRAHGYLEEKVEIIMCSVSRVGT